MPYTPERPQPPNPFPSGMPPGAPSPGMAHPPWNPSGQNPGYAVAQPLQTYGEQKGQDFRFVTAESVWRWTIRSALLDLRPGINSSIGPSGISTPTAVNHEAALGLNQYLNVLIFPQTPASVSPSSFGLMTCDYWEEGNPSTTDSIYQLTQVIDITDVMQAGGPTQAAATDAPGAVNLNFTPPAGLHFWRVVVRLSIPGVVGVRPSTDFAAWLAAH